MTATLTPNQVVGHNLRRARELRGWTQQQAADELAPYLGASWSQSAWAIAEGSRKRGARRVRHFTADELVAFAQAFDLPVAFFLVPPPAEAADVEAVTVAAAGGEVDRALTAGELTRYVLAGWSDGLAALHRHVEESVAGVEWEREERYADAVEQARAEMLAVLGSVLGDDLGRAADQLRATAETLETARALAVVRGSMRATTGAGADPAPDDVNDDQED